MSKLTGDRSVYKKKEDETLDHPCSVVPSFFSASTNVSEVHLFFAHLCVNIEIRHFLLRAFASPFLLHVVASVIGLTTTLIT